eukprot:gene2547-743_t
MSQNTNKKPLVETKQRAATRKTNLAKPKSNKKETENNSAPGQLGKISESENSNPKQLSMREKLERWKEEKGKNRCDNVNPLLSRKRPLVTAEKKKVAPKKKKTEGQNKSNEKLQRMANKPVDGNEIEKPEDVVAVQDEGHCKKQHEEMQVEGKQEIQSEDATLIINTTDSVLTPKATNKEEDTCDQETDKSYLDQNLQSTANVVKEDGGREPLSISDNGLESPLKSTNNQTLSGTLANLNVNLDASIEGKDDVVPEGHEHCQKALLHREKELPGQISLGITMEAIEEEVEDSEGCEEDKINDKFTELRSPCEELAKQHSIQDEESGLKPLATKERFANFPSFSLGTPSKHHIVKKVVSKTPEATDRRRTMCITPSTRLSSLRPVISKTTPVDVSSKKVSFNKPNDDRTKTPQIKVTPFRNGVKRFSSNSVFNSAPLRRTTPLVRRSQSSGKFDVPGTVIESHHNENKLDKEKVTTPFQRRMSRLPASSVLKSAPVRPVVPFKKTEISDSINKPQLFSTPSANRTNILESRGILKSAPSRRSTSVLVTQRSSAKKMQGAMENKARRKRRNTIHYSNREEGTEKEMSTPVVMAPFTPRGEWQNKNLSIRERLDLWLTAKGNTVKKPFVVQKTPKRRKTFSPSDDVGLNTTFTMDTSGEGEVDDDVVNVEKRIPKMNAIEESIVAESLQQMIARLDKPFEEDSIKEELDLILSTSPGVVRLASFWIIRARLAAVNGNVERVICLLEQANAFGAQPQSVIRDEICKYLEQLKENELESADNDQGVPSYYRSDELNYSRKATTTPAKRVTFVESQQHVVFKSSLIKFCLLESTPFRKKLKSTLARQVLTPVRRSGRIEKVESRLSSVVRSHNRTVSSPRDLESNIRDGDVYFMPNPNVETKWNELWGVDSTAVSDEQELSFC